MKKSILNNLYINVTRYYGEPELYFENSKQHNTFSESSFVIALCCSKNNASSKHFDLYNTNINTYDIPLIS